MKCARCLQENRASAKFCVHCGSPLGRACAACGKELTPAANYCPDCGHPAAPPRSADDPFASPGAYTPAHLAEKILTSRSALEGERKQVTVLFADIKDSMEMLAGRDPEEARRILDPVLQLMIDAVHRYEGTVNQIMGDGIMALFGAPVAHEDHAVRACLAALRIQEVISRHSSEADPEHGLRVQVRVGLNSGEVVVRSIGSDLHMDYTAVGQTTHLAARMEQMAAPGAILATGSTVRLAEGYVAVGALGRQPVRGLATTVDVYSIVGIGAVRWALEAAAARGLTDFVGREAELAMLGRAMQSAASGRGQVVGVVGEPGVGKSRLFREFTRQLTGWLILRTCAVSYDKATAYGAVIDLFRSYFGAADRQDQRGLGEKVTARALALDPTLAPRIPALLSLLGATVEAAEWQSLDPSRRRRQTMEAVTGVLLAESRVQPVCLVFEDLHWIDSETQAFLDGLIDILPVARVLLLVNYRPEYRHQWTGRTYFAQIRMDALPPSNAQALLRILLGPGDDLAAVGQKLIERTEGNPFFLEESVRALAEDGVLVGERGHYRLARPIQTIRVPATVQAVLAARMDRLAAEDKRLLQSASVIGENVPLALLRAVADLPEAELAERLTRLRNAEFLYESGLGPDPTDVFRHGLTCQVACDSLLQERRKALHGRIVDAIELLYPERLAEHVERLAHHSRGSERWDKAIRYLRQAGTKAFAHSANREAVAWLEQALEILTRLPDTAEAQDEALEIHLSLRNALTILGEHEQTLRHLGEARRLAEHTGDRRRLGRALSFEVNCLFLLGRHEQAIRVAARAAEIAGELGDVPLRTVTDMYAGRSHLYLGDFPRAIELFGGIVAALTGPLALDHLGIPVLPSVFARSHLVESLAEVGRFEEGERHAREALELAETTNHPDTLLWAFHGAGVHHLARGEPGPARQALEQAYSICRAHDMLTYRPRISSELGLAWALDGRAGEAVPMVEQAVEEAAARRQTTSYWQVLLLLAEVYLLADRVPESAKAAADALGHFREQRARGYEARALRLLGDVGSREAADAGAARAYYEEAVDLAERLGMRPLLGRACLGLGRLLARTGETARARQALEIASARFRESGMTADLARVEGELRVAGC